MPDEMGRRFVPFDKVRDEMDERLRRERGWFAYRRHVIWRWWYRRVLGVRWRWQRVNGRAVRGLQRLCRHDQCQLVETAAGPWLSVCGFCEYIDVDYDEGGHLQVAKERAADVDDVLDQMDGMGEAERPDPRR